MFIRYIYKLTTGISSFFLSKIIFIGLLIQTNVCSNNFTNKPLLISLRFILFQDTNRQDSSGKTPLHTAILAKQFSIVEMLLEHNADVTLKDDAGDTVLHTAIRVGSERLVQVRIRIRLFHLNGWLKFAQVGSYIFLGKFRAKQKKKKKKHIHIFTCSLSVNLNNLK